MILNVLLLQLAFALPTDSHYLKVVADSFAVPVEIALGVAYTETGSGRHWDALGPGKMDTTWVNDVLTVRRVCRELGRFQLSPCINWVSRLHDPLCTYHNLRYVYEAGVQCGMENLSYLLTKYHDPITVIRRQNGDGPKSWDYVKKVLSYIGWLFTTHKEILA